MTTSPYSVRPGLADDLKVIASKKGEADPGQVKGIIDIFRRKYIHKHFVFFHSGIKMLFLNFIIANDLQMPVRFKYEQQDYSVRCSIAFAMNPP